MSDRAFTTTAGAEMTGTTAMTVTITDDEQRDPIMRWLLEVHDEFTAERTFTTVHEGLVMRRLRQLRRPVTGYSTSKLRLQWEQAHADWARARRVEQTLFDVLESRGEQPHA